MSLRNTTSAHTLNRNAQLTYDPFYSMNLGFDPRWSFTEKFYARGHFDLARDLTRSNWTTRGGEYVVSDVVLAAGLSPVYTIPVAEIAIGAELGVRIPTSLQSRASTMQLGLEPSLRLNRNFKVLQGLSLGYAASPWFAMHRYTTASLESPVISACAAGSADCERFLNAGDRNAPWGQSHSVSAGLQILSWLGVGASAGVHLSHLYPVSQDERVNFTPVEPQNTQYANSFGLSASVQPVKSLSISLGASTFNPQLAPDSKPYTFAFNRYTQFFLDLRFEPGTLFSQLRGTAAGDRQ